MMAPNASVQCLLSCPGLIKYILQSSRSPGSGRREVKRSVVIFMHFCPVGDPEFLAQFLLGLKGQVIAFLFAYFHTVVLWHYPVVNSPLEETTLPKTENQRNISGKSITDMLFNITTPKFKFDRLLFFLCVFFMKVDSDLCCKTQKNVTKAIQIKVNHMTCALYFRSCEAI